MLIVATGLKMVPNFAKALNATHKFLHAMGSKVAPNKSYNFSSSKKAREWLKQTSWENINSEIRSTILGGTPCDKKFNEQRNLGQKMGEGGTAAKEA